MAITIDAREESTFIINVQITDDEDAQVIPNEMTWTLTDKQNNVVNERDGVSFAVPAESMDIVLQGDDLGLDVVTDRMRILTVEGTYNSDAGSNLPFKDACKFFIRDLDSV